MALLVAVDMTVVVQNLHNRVSLLKKGMCVPSLQKTAVSRVRNFIFYFYSMKKLLVGSLLIISAVALSSCTIGAKKIQEDSMKLEGMMPKEDNKTIDAMMKKTEANATEENNAMMMKKEDTMMKKETPGVYTPYADSLVKSSLASGKNVILFFHARWCPTCKAADANFLKETAPADTVVLKVDYDSSAELKKKYGVTSQHTFVSLNTDETLKKKSAGATHFADLADL